MTFYDFLTKIRPLVNAKGLNDAAGLPRNALSKHYHWVDSGGVKGRPLPEKHFAAVEKTLREVFGIATPGTG